MMLVYKMDISEYEDYRIPRPLEEWDENMGDVLWWHFPICEAPYVGTPYDSAFETVEDSWWTHWTPILMAFDPND
jgi:hypothetical protein